LSRIDTRDDDISINVVYTFVICKSRHVMVVNIVTEPATQDIATVVSYSENTASVGRMIGIGDLEMIRNNTIVAYF
jgi:hypothetical protein